MLSAAGRFYDGRRAHVVKPAATQITGAECYSGSGRYAGDVAFGFPVRGMNAGLSFTIGPLRDGMSPGQEDNKPYSGSVTSLRSRGRLCHRLLMSARF